MEKKLRKRFRVMTIAFFLLACSSIGAHVANAETIQNIPTAEIAINGKAVNGINPIKIDGVYFLPFVPLAKSLGYNYIKFNKKTLTYEITDGSTTIRITMGGTRAKKGNEYVNIKPPRWIHETAYVSLHAGGALFNSYITFKPENGSIQIQKPAQKYVAHTGDTLWNISRIHHVTLANLKAANNLTSNIVKDGQILTIPPRDQAKEMEPIRKHEPIKNTNHTSVTAQRQKVLQQAKEYLGAGYKYGASLNEAPKLFDCSSYTKVVFADTGISLPRVSRDQANKGISVKSLEAGDLMFFTIKDSYSDGRVGHVGIYMGDGSMIHASSSKGVSITNNVLQNPYWSKNYLFSKRVIK
jgi:peptidoglycan DL-endopeptidase LytE